MGTPTGTPMGTPMGTPAGTQVNLTAELTEQPNKNECGGASNIGEGPGATEVMILRNCSRTIVTLDVIFAGFLRMKNAFSSTR